MHRALPSRAAKPEIFARDRFSVIPLWTPVLSVLKNFCRHPAVGLLVALLTAAILTPPVRAFAQEKSDGGQISKAVGVIKSVQANSITIASEAGGELIASLSASTKILRVPPGEKDLKNAITLQVEDLQPGDRVLIRGQAASDDANIIAALAIIVMKQADVAAKQQHERDDWQKRGVGGLVTKVDASSTTITISSGGFGATRNITVHIAKDTILRRYAPGSVKFDDAKPESAAEFMAQIKPNDQLRARGTRTADGGEITADEVVFGSFRNIAGTIKSIDASTNAMTVQDAITKSSVAVKVTSDSQMKKLPPEMAQRLAMRLKATAGGTGADQSGANGQAHSTQSPGAGRESTDARSGDQSQTSRAAGGNGPPDFQRMLSRLPNARLSDLQKGDAVMIVSTEAGDSGSVTAITLLAGVDAILTAAPNRNASSLLSPWSLNPSGGEGDAASQ